MLQETSEKTHTHTHTQRKATQRKKKKNETKTKNGAVRAGTYAVHFAPCPSSASASSSCPSRAFFSSIPHSSHDAIPSSELLTPSLLSGAALSVHFTRLGLSTPTHRTPPRFFFFFFFCCCFFFFVVLPLACVWRSISLTHSRSSLPPCLLCFFCLFQTLTPRCLRLPCLVCPSVCLPVCLSGRTGRAAAPPPPRTRGEEEESRALRCGAVVRWCVRRGAGEQVGARASEQVGESRRECASE